MRLPAQASANVISSNEHNGVRISASGSSGNHVAGNNIGTGEGGMPLGNYQGGIRIENGASNNVIGSSPSTAAVDALMANTIAWNGGLPVGGQSGAGVAVVSNQAVGNSIRGNSIYLNGGLGIDLGDNGVTPPNSNVGITGPNNLQNFPIITNSIVEHAGTSTFTVVWGSLYSAPNSSFTVDIYSDPTPDPRGYGPGQNYLYTVKAQTNGQGIATFWAQIPGAVTTDLSATATDATGDTSEFGPSILVTLQQVQFNGTGNERIKIDATTMIGTPTDPSGASGDVQWVKDSRQGANSPGVAWDTTQAAPAAFLIGKNMQATASFTATGLGGQSSPITGFTILGQSTAPRGQSAGPYGNFTPQTVTLTSGQGSGNFTSANTVNDIEANNEKFYWRIQSFSVAGAVYPTNYVIQTTTNRIYTVYAPATGSMAPAPGSTAPGPWVPVLELAADMASGTGKNPANASDAVSAITNGVYNSTWTTLNPKPYFINATATFKYDPSGGGVVYAPIYSGPDMGATFGTQSFGLTSFLTALSGATLTCQCNEIADFQSIVLAALGIQETPLAISGSGWSASGPYTPYLSYAAYYAAGSTTQTPGTLTSGKPFMFHQFGVYNGNVYDCATGATAGSPNAGSPLATYLANVFPGLVLTGPLAPVPNNAQVTSITVH